MSNILGNEQTDQTDRTDRSGRSGYGSFTSLSRGKHVQPSDESGYVSFRSEDAWGRPRGRSFHDFDDIPTVPDGPDPAPETDTDGMDTGVWLWFCMVVSPIWRGLKSCSAICGSACVRGLKCCYTRDLSYLSDEYEYESSVDWASSDWASSDWACGWNGSGSWNWSCFGCCGAQSPHGRRNTAAYRPPIPLLRVSHPLYVPLIDPRDPGNPRSRVSQELSEKPPGTGSGKAETDELREVCEVCTFHQFVAPKLKMFVVSVVISVLYVYTKGESMAYLQTPIAPTTPITSITSNTPPLNTTNITDTGIPHIPPISPITHPIPDPDRVPIPGFVSPHYQVTPLYHIGEVSIPHFSLENTSTIVSGLDGLGEWGWDTGDTGDITASGGSTGTGYGTRTPTTTTTTHITGGFRVRDEPYWSWWLLCGLDGWLSLLMCAVQLVWWGLIIQVSIYIYMWGVWYI